jgi:hypothetical protein
MKRILLCILLSLLLLGCVTKPDIKIPTIPKHTIERSGLNIIFINDLDTDVAMELQWINHPWRDKQKVIKPWTMANGLRIESKSATWSAIFSKELDEPSYWNLIWKNPESGKIIAKHHLIVTPGKYVIKATPNGFECDGCKIEIQGSGKDTAYTFIDNRFYK